MTPLAIIKSWQPYEAEYGIADTLRCAAMVEQEEHGFARRAEFIAAAAELGYNAKTAAVCWAYVKRQEAA